MFINSPKDGRTKLGKTRVILESSFRQRVTWPKGVKHFSCSTQPSMKFKLLIKFKIAIIKGILG